MAQGPAHRGAGSAPRTAGPPQRTPRAGPAPRRLVRARAPVLEPRPAVPELRSAHAQRSADQPPPERRAVLGPGRTGCNRRLGRGNELSPCNSLRRRLGWRRGFCRSGHYRRGSRSSANSSAADCVRRYPAVYTVRTAAELKATRLFEIFLLEPPRFLGARCLFVAGSFVGFKACLPRSDAMTCRNYRRFHSEAGLKTRATTAHVAQDFVLPGKRESVH